MAMRVPVHFFGLDALSALLALGVVGFFAVSWRRSGSPLHLLLAVGFLLVGASFLGASTSHYTEGTNTVVDALRLAGQLGGALVIFFAYLSARHRGDPRPWRALGWAAAAGSVLLAALYVAPPTGAFPPVRAAFLPAHALMVAAYGGCAALAARGWRRHPSPTRALVPLAFVAWALTKYTWLLIDVSGASILVPFVYLWRLAALVLLVGAVAWPVVPPRQGVARAPA